MRKFLNKIGIFIVSLTMILSTVGMAGIREVKAADTDNYLQVDAFESGNWQEHPFVKISDVSLVVNGQTHIGIHAVNDRDYFYFNTLGTSYNNWGELVTLTTGNIYLQYKYKGDSYKLNLKDTRYTNYTTGYPGNPNPVTTEYFTANAGTVKAGHIWLSSQSAIDSMVYNFYTTDNIVGKTGNENKMNAAYDSSTGYLTWDCKSIGNIDVYDSAAATTPIISKSNFNRFFTKIYFSNETDFSEAKKSNEIGGLNVGGAKPTTEYCSTSTINPYINIKRFLNDNMNSVNADNCKYIWIEVSPCDITAVLPELQGGKKVVNIRIDRDIVFKKEITPIVDQTFDPKNPVTPALTIKVDDKKLEAGKDYNVTYENNKNAGTAKAKITYIGNYAYLGTEDVSFEIVAKTLTDSDVIVADVPTQDYTGNEIKPTPKVTLTDGTELNYTVAYSNNKEPGTATITYTLIGNYSGTITKTFKIDYNKNVKDALAMIKDNGKIITNADQNNCDQILSAKVAYDALSVADKAAFNKALKEAGGTTFEDLYLGAQAEKFLNDYATDKNGKRYNSVNGVNYAQIHDGDVAEKGNYSNLDAKLKNAINDRLSSTAGTTYDNLLNAATDLNNKANDFIAKYVTENKATIKAVTADNYKTILGGSDEWDKLSQDEKDAINTALLAEKDGVSYDDLLKAAQTVEEHANDFIKNYVSDDEGNIYKAATAENYEQILSGKDSWDKLTSDEKDAINAILTADGGKTYEALLEEVETINEHVNDFIKNYVSDEKGNVYKVATAQNYGQLLNGKSTWEGYTQEEKDAINAILVAKGGKTYEELLKSAEALFDNTVDFIVKYLADDKGNIYKAATAQNYAQILSGKDAWDKLSQEEKDAINTVLTYNGGKTYEELLKISETLETNSTSFIKKYVSNDKGIYKVATKDNYAQILSGKAEWDKMTQDQKDAINAILLANGGKAYDDLLKQAEEIKKSVKTGDDNEILPLGILMVSSLLLGGYEILRKKKRA